MSKPSSALFDVFLRLRPSVTDRDRFLDVEEPEPSGNPTHITIKPSVNDNRKRAVEKFAFTRVFEENAGQRDLFEDIGVLPLIGGVLGQPGKEGRDGLLATLGVTGSGKSHTILGTKSQRGLTQMTLDVLFSNLEPRLVDAEADMGVFSSLSSEEFSEANIYVASQFLDNVYDNGSARCSRATTPALDMSLLSVQGSKRYVPRISTLPQSPSMEDMLLGVDDKSEYALVISMYEVYNDRIFDLLTGSTTGKTPQKRRALLYKNTERSPDRKVVAGLNKVICSNLEEALLVLETGLHERRIAGTGSNAVSSRSHGFFCIDVKKRSCKRSGAPGIWSNSTMTIVDLAGSERARTAKTAGATLAEAGKINESLMYLGQCMQMQSDNAHATTPNLVPFRQCKLTELLFSNSLAHNSNNSGYPHRSSPPQQKGIMIVTADPLGDFNATSQILRYSALAREITVPRIPSVSSTILASGTTISTSISRQASGQSSSSATLIEDLETALAEAASLRAELDLTQVQLEEETSRRIAAESSWAATQTRIDDIEAEIRDEVWSEMEARLALEQRRWRAARDAEADRSDEHLDRKLDILVRGVGVYDRGADGDKENVAHDQLTPSTKKSLVTSVTTRVDDLESENALLRERLARLEREQGQRSPSKKMRVLKSRKWDGSGTSLDGSP